MKNVFLRSHNPLSQGAKELADALSIRRIAHKRSRFTPRASLTVINWGASELPDGYEKCRIINAPDKVTIATNKLSCFQTISGSCRVVPFTTDRDTVKEWLSDGYGICARTKLRASQADGLVIFDGVQPFVNAPLWTQYVKKKDEYRIHILGGEVISVQRKALKKDFETDEDVDHRIRNLANGYIFARENLVVPDDVRGQALAAVLATKLDFGAVDIIWNEKKQQGFVLEINTAPGLEGTTISDYANGFKRFIGE